MCSPDILVNMAIDSPYEGLYVNTEQCQDVPIIQQPQYYRAKISIWELMQIFHLEDYKENKRSAILLDFYTYTFKFARDNSFSREQTSAFFSIMKKTHEVCIETPFGNFDQCFHYFKEMVLCHAVRRPPFSIDLFNVDDVKKIMEYGINTYFRNFKLYKYIFTPQVFLDLTMVYKGMPETPPPTAVCEETEEIEEVEVNAPEVVETEPQKEEDSLGASELKRLIRQHLAEEIKQMKISVDQQIKQTEEDINKKLEANGSPAKAGKDKKK